MLHVILWEMDELKSDGAVFRHELKMTAKVFVAELEKFIAAFYSTLKKEDHCDDAENLYYQEIKNIEVILKDYYSTNN